MGRSNAGSSLYNVDYVCGHTHEQALNNRRCSSIPHWRVVAIGEGRACTRGDSASAKEHKTEIHHCILVLLVLHVLGRLCTGW
jgi:hypothetical protein